MAAAEVPAGAPRGHRGRRLGRGIAALAVLLVALAGGGYLVLLAALPRIDGRIEVSGLEHPVRIVRDRFAIPHIEAESFLDATFALGFVHAQDRLWQMEFQRRLGAGRLAELLGEAALPIDRFMRTLGFYAKAEAGLAHLAPDTRAWLEAYAAGVNAHLATRRGPLPPEFLILRHFQVEPWTPADSAVWIRLMAFDLSSNWRDELLRARLAARLSEARIADLWPDYPEDAPTSLAGLTRGLPLDALAAALPPAPPAPAGSNAWVVAGEHATTGAPLLANDPHLGMQAPGTWYLAHLRSPEIEVIGATLPGVPGVTLGHNGHVAWGFTTTGSDTQDLFIEQVDPGDPARYLVPDGSALFDVREEVIRVRGGDPLTLRVRETRHGPVLSDLLPEAAAVAGENRVLAFAWTGLEADDRSLQALFRVLAAEDGPGFVAALRDVGAPQQNVLWADVAGRIGLHVPGRVPLRRAGDGRWPVPGWSGDFDWTGWIPFEELPGVEDPADGMLFNANNRVVPEDYPHLITADWDAYHRARRIAGLLPAGPHDLAGFAAMQADQRSPLAEDFLPFLLAVEPADGRAAALLARLRDWDLVMRKEAVEPLVFAAWYGTLERLVYGDELGDLVGARWRIRPDFMHLVLTGREVWCDDVTTAARETCTDMAAGALELALADLEARFGADPKAWRWGEAHRAWMAHAIFEDVPVLGWLFNITLPTGGDSTTLDVGHFRVHDPVRPYASVHAASYRGLFDLADLDRSRFIAATGQSGHPLSPHYRDLARLWAAGRSVPMTRDAAAYREGALGILVLSPGG